MPESLMNIRVEHKAFAGNTVLHGIDLSLQSGEIVSLLGPSGCGKSTLLRIVAGLEQDFRGSVQRIQGEVAFVFQEPRLMPWLTVAQNIGFSDDDRYDRHWVGQLIEEVGLSGFADALPKALSGAWRSAWLSRAACTRTRRCCCWMSRSAQSMRLPG